jgi:glyceraldehyde 3-phosphate dehydrogenase
MTRVATNGFGRIGRTFFRAYLERRPNFEVVAVNALAAVFAGGDGLCPYRRLIDAAGTSLTASGTLLLQLYRRVVIADRRQLASLRYALDTNSEGLIRHAA